MTKNELLEKAKKDYPPGTIFNSTAGNINCKIQESHVFYFDSDDDITIKINNAEVLGRVYNYKNKKWAEIVFKPEFVEPQENLLTTIL